MKMRHQTHKDVPGPSREGDGLSSEEIGEDEDGEDTSVPLVSTWDHLGRGGRSMPSALLHF